MAVLFTTFSGKDSTYGLPEEPGKEVTLGRADACDIRLADDPAVSTLHCAILCTPEGYIITDKNSSNGTYRGESRVTREAMHPGVVYRVGDSEIQLLQTARSAHAPLPASEQGTAPMPPASEQGTAPLPPDSGQGTAPLPVQDTDGTYIEDDGYEYEDGEYEDGDYEDGEYEDEDGEYEDGEYEDGGYEDEDGEYEDGEYEDEDGDEAYTDGEVPESSISDEDVAAALAAAQAVDQAGGAPPARLKPLTGRPKKKTTLTRKTAGKKVNNFVNGALSGLLGKPAGRPGAAPGLRPVGMPGKKRVRPTGKTPGKPAARPGAQPALRPVGMPAPGKRQAAPMARPSAKPAAQTVVKPVAAPATPAVVKPVAAPATPAVVKPVAAPATPAVVKPVAAPATPAVVKPTPAPAAQPAAADSRPKPVLNTGNARNTLGGAVVASPSTALGGAMSGLDKAYIACVLIAAFYAGMSLYSWMYEGSSIPVFFR